MINQFDGLPAHILLVHVVVIVIPLAAFLTIVSAVWPSARRRLGVITPLTALVGLVFVPITTSAGEWLERRVQETALVRKHVQLGDSLLPWAIGLFVLSTALWLLDFSRVRGWHIPAAARASWVRVTLSVVVVVVAVIAVVQVYRIGDSGAKAAWDGRFSTSESGPGR
jgi:hypothetical protein